MKEEILDYEIKAKYLRDNGWVTNWDENKGCQCVGNKLYLSKKL